MSGRTARLAVWCALASMFAYRISINVVDLDLFHEMAIAREWITHGAIPRADVFAFTPTRNPVVHHEWGAGLVAYLLAAAFGGAGILALRAVLAFVLAMIVVKINKRTGSADVAWVLAPVAILLADYGFSPVRAQAYSFVFAAALMWLLCLDREGTRSWVLAYVPLILVWANIHAGVLVGLALLGVEIFDRLLTRRRWGHLGLLLVLSMFVLLLTPYGTGYYAYLWRATTMPRPNIQEWSPLLSRATPPHAIAAFFASVAIAVYAASTSGAGIARVHGTLPLFMFAAASIWHTRMLPFYAIAWLTIVPIRLGRTPVGEAARSVLRKWPSRVGGAAAIVTVMFAVLWFKTEPWRLVVPNEPGHQGSPLSYPVGAVHYLESARFRGNLLTPFEQGAYVSWKLYPNVRVSLDSRYEVAYSDGLVDEIAGFYRGMADVEAIVAKYGADALLVPNDAALARKKVPWPCAYRDEGFTVYVRPGVALASVSLPISTDDGFP